MDYQPVFDVLTKYFDKKSCLDYVHSIYENDRWSDFAAFGRTADVCECHMREMGLEQVEKLPLKADGTTAYGDWVIPKAWDVTDAILKVAGEGGRVLADYHSTPCSLVMYSAPTPLQGVEAEIVRIDDPTVRELPDVKGKLILTVLRPKELVEVAVHGGALGILSDYFPMYGGVRKSREQMWNASRWDNDFIIPINDTGLFAFSLTPANAHWLRQAVSTAEQEGHALRLHAKVVTRFYNGECFTVSGLLRGRNQDVREVFVYGHLYEQGANDNASGCGLILELARCLKKAIDKGDLPLPEYSIRFVMGYECCGSMGYFHLHPDRHTICGLVTDMVGTEKIDNTHLCLWHNPMSNWSYTDTIMLDINRSYQQYSGNSYPWEEKPFILGSDNIVSDPIFHIPIAAMITEPALSYHSSMDTVERIDPYILKRNGIIAGTYLYALSNMDDDGLSWLSDKMLEHALNLAAPGVNEMGTYLINQACGQALLSLKELAKDTSTPICYRIEQQAEQLIACPPPAMMDPDRQIVEDGGLRIPIRVVKGCLTFSNAPELAVQWQPAWNEKLNMPLFWADGKRTMWEITVLSAAEQHVYDPDCVRSNFYILSKYFDFLSLHQYLNWC